MKSSLQPGARKTTRLTVDRPRTIGFMGDKGRVYATPAMVQDIEHLCRDLLLEHLDEGEDSVGTRVAIDHLAATPEGMGAELDATIDSVDGRLVTFAISGKDAVDDIVKGKHVRFVVDVAKTFERLSAKAAKVKIA